MFSVPLSLNSSESNKSDILSVEQPLGSQSRRRIGKKEESAIHFFAINILKNAKCNAWQSHSYFTFHRYMLCSFFSFSRYALIIVIRAWEHYGMTMTMPAMNSSMLWKVTNLHTSCRPSQLRSTNIFKSLYSLVPFLILMPSFNSIWRVNVWIEIHWINVRHLLQIRNGWMKCVHVLHKSNSIFPLYTRRTVVIVRGFLMFCRAQNCEQHYIFIYIFIDVSIWAICLQTMVSSPLAIIMPLFILRYCFEFCFFAVYKIEQVIATHTMAIANANSINDYICYQQNALILFLSRKGTINDDN